MDLIPEDDENEAETADGNLRSVMFLYFICYTHWQFPLPPTPEFICSFLQIKALIYL